MSVDVRKWRKDDPEKVLGLSDDAFAVIDPGSKGVALAFKPLRLWEPGPTPRPLIVQEIKGYDGALAFAQRCADRSVRVLIIEEPFAGRENVQSALKTASTASFAAGAFMYACAGYGPATVMLPAQSWQAKYIPRSLGDREARKVASNKKGEAIMGDDSRWRAANKETRSAISDALGMATWWAMVRRPELFA